MGGGKLLQMQKNSHWGEREVTGRHAPTWLCCNMLDEIRYVNAYNCRKQAAKDMSSSPLLLSCCVSGYVTATFSRALHLVLNRGAGEIQFSFSCPRQAPSPWPLATRNSFPGCNLA